MYLSEVFEQLTAGELSQLSIGGGEAGAITEANYKNVIAHVNLGLAALYKRFTLKEGRFTIGLLADRTTYPIASKYAASATRSREMTKYILDSAMEPFEDDLIKVERVTTSSGYEMGLNDLADKYSVFTPNALTLRVPVALVNEAASLPDCLKTETLDVVYRASHKKIVMGLGYFDPTREELELPESHLMALLLFVASRVNNPIGMTNEFHAGNSYAAKYEAECAQLEGMGLRVDKASQNTGIQRNGWV
jgi:hypothetical protein